MANVAYVRVSTIEQDDNRQIEDLKRFDIARWFKEKISGKTTKNRKQLQEMLDYVREGDIVYIESFSRLARNTKDLLDIMEILENRKVGLISLKENIDTNTPAGRMILTMIASIYQFERECMLDRQKEGVALAKAEGKYKGRRAVKRPDDWDKLKELYQTRKLTGTALAKKCDVSRPLVYKWIKEDNEQG